MDIDMTTTAANSDPLRHVRKLHPAVLRDFDKILVDRHGGDDRAFMVLEDIIGDIAPGAAYRIERDGLTLVSSDMRTGLSNGPTGDGSGLRYAEFEGQWDGEAAGGADVSNILGGNGTLTVRSQKIQVPVADTTPENVASYGATLLKVGDVVEFETSEYLPVTVTNIGETYVKNFLYAEGKGGGAYIEYHDRPHFHMPLEASARGYLLLGKIVGGRYRVSAFAIPNGFAIYTGPNVLHADSFLVGRYAVVYSVTEHFSTVLFKDQNGAMVELEIDEAAR